MRLALLLALLLSGCGYVSTLTQPALREWRAVVMGVNIEYRIVPGRASAAALIGNTCTVALGGDLSGERLVWVAAHEMGHCLDGAYLGWSSNGFGNAGCEYGAYYCTAREGYAELFARQYHAACGSARSPLGLRPGDGVRCELPDPRGVGPWGVNNY